MLGDGEDQEEARAYSLLVHGRVSDFMSKPPITLIKGSTMGDARALMRDHRISGIPIVDDESHLIGIVTLENIIIAIENQVINDPVENHMIKDVVYLLDDMDISIVMEYLRKYTYGRYPVVDREKRVVGVMTKGDLMIHLYKRLGNIYMHNKTRDDVLDPDTYPSSSETMVNEHAFNYMIDTQEIEQAGTGATLFKKFLTERDFPQEATRRASIALYEAEVNVVIHADGKGEIKAYLGENQLIMIISDHGSGIEDIELAMQPGYTTASDEVREHGFGAGMGLDNIQKYSDKLAIISSGTGVKIEIIIIPKEDGKEVEDN